MARIRNANRGTFKRFKKKQGALAVQTPLSSTAVERGSTRWLEGSLVAIEGVLDVTGTLNGSGTNNLDGINNLDGENHLTGPTDVAGDFEIIAGGQFKAGQSTINPDGSAKFGTLDIAPDGTLTVRNDVNIEAGGKVTAGNVSLKPDFGGVLEFGNGAIADSDGLGLGISHNGAVRVNADHIQLNAPTIGMTLASKPASELTPIGIDAAGNIYRIA